MLNVKVESNAWEIIKIMLINSKKETCYFKDAIIVTLIY